MRSVEMIRDPRYLKMVTGESKRTTFDRETGLHPEWYFRLCVDVEIARAKRYAQPFAVVTVTSDERQTLDAARIAIEQTCSGSHLNPPHRAIP